MLKEWLSVGRGDLGDREVFISCQQRQENYEKKRRLKRREVSPFKKQRAAF